MQKMMQKHRKVMKNGKGFSLVELIIVIAIMAALVAILAPQYIKYVDKSRQSVDISAVDGILGACKAIAIDSETYEAASPGFTITWAADGTVTCTDSKSDVADAEDTITEAIHALVGDKVDGKSKAFAAVTVTFDAGTSEFTVNGPDYIRTAFAANAAPADPVTT